MTTISDEYKKMLQEFHASTHPERQSGECTISEYAEATGLTVEKAGRFLNSQFNLGKIQRPPKRYINGAMTVVYKIPSTSKDVE